uniref:DUF4592 domain-containing protein n=1 Tax=Sphenodon punctatus TaxID=8508 RepID=A0A8D0H1G2_SPHPU
MAGFYNCLKSKNDCMMATGPTDVSQPPEAGETSEECSGKKKSKFQTFKNFFAKKKRKEPPAPRGESNLKPSQSSSDVSIPALDPRDLNSSVEPGSKGSMGNKALSHDSVFIFESAPENVAGDRLSQENIPGKVRALQLRLEQNIRLGSPPLVITGKKTEDAGAVSEDDGLPRSPPEISTLHEVLTCSSSKIPSEASSRPISPLSSAVLTTPTLRTSSLLPVDFNSPASPAGCLDTSAARHKIAVNPRKQKVFTTKNQPSIGEKGEKEPSLPIAEDKKRSQAKLLDVDQHEKNWEGSSIQDEGHAKESEIWTPPVASRSTDSTHHPQNSVSLADIICTLVPEETRSLMETDVSYNVTESFLKVLPSLSKPEEENKVERACCPTGEFGHCPQNSDKKVTDLPESLPMETEAVVFCDTIASDLYRSDVEEEGISPLAEVMEETSPKRVDQSANKPRDSSAAFEGKAAQPGTKEISSITPDTSISLGPSQVSLATAESSSEAESLPEYTPADQDDAGQSADLELEPFGDHIKTKAFPAKNSAMPISDVDCMLLQSKSGGELPFEAELLGSVSEVSCGGQEAEASTHWDKPPVRGHPFSRLTDAASKTCTPSKDVSKEDLLGRVTSPGKARKESKSPEENIKNPLMSAAAKPVRFTIAPAWQRSLSGGSNSKDDSSPRSSPSSPIRSELFEGTAHLDVVMQEFTRSNLEGLDRDNKFEASLNSSMEWAEHETQSVGNPFGVRLRRTSSLLKYQSEQRSESPKQVLLAASVTSSASVKDDPKAVGAGKPLQGLPGSTKRVVKKSGSQEEKNPPKTKPEEVAKKPCTSKPTEKVPSAQLETTSSEPAWISVAKLKQKGFQGHLLAKEDKSEEKMVPKMDLKERMSCTSENLLRRNIIPGL